MVDEAHDSQRAAAQEAGILHAIAQKKASDPLIGAKFVGKEILQRLLNGLKSERGVQVESLLVALGSLAGYSCQAGIVAEYVLKKVDIIPFTIVTGADGKTLFFGDALNKPLLESQH